MICVNNSACYNPSTCSVSITTAALIDAAFILKLTNENPAGSSAIRGNRLN